MQKIFLFILFVGTCFISQSQNIVKVYNVPSSKQAVAVDSKYFYVINNSSITKHQKSDGLLVDSWEDKDSLIHHMNSGIIIRNKLYCINSNYPDIPMASSLEIFNPITLEHVSNHSFGILNGSATWVYKYKNFWYVAFAHYSGKDGMEGQSNVWTRLVKFDRKWRQVESWIFPKELLKKFGTKSNSGGVILSDGKVLITGHDNFETYVLEFPNKGVTLKWVDTIPVGSYGQGIAYEKDGKSEFIYGIIKKESKVVVTKIK
ncbi:MAG: hypothetical protein A2W90_24160 [Bacteroidetes bacterium GWF2_42_66]|nr:MAG: hypothetical protein A2W92_15270 [Bacteroidetes bacterium GWA2_42_15]OFX97978.1 MAG: hypothetical protein A2W89_07940 [Bacteroidetes bacterium GWE2_42_39]OFY45785.1 MAG: hypothetical protein A2W90_24160 [Bacteroidetes bacterium GWF2_42_66]HBL74716.1 hypothetical protein [Prolixibacteraceae bacterium]HCR89407.1 hypothetical protein [Prolixibacteraceae bacterium]